MVHFLHFNIEQPTSFIQLKDSVSAGYSRTLLFFILVSVFALSSCAVTQPLDESAQKVQKYWPDLPVAPRFMHEGSLRFTNDITPKSQDEKFKEMITGPRDPTPAFLRPYDVVAQFGRIYISDSDAGLISVYDVPRRRYYRLGNRLQGQLVKPMGLALDEQSSLYVADMGSKSIKVYDFLGLYIRTFGEEDNLQQPMSVAVDKNSDRVYVVDNGGIDSDQHRVLVYDKKANLIQTIGKRGHEAGEFNLPTDAIVGGDGNLYVLDSGNFRVQAFDSKGNYLKHWGEAGSTFGQFGRPRSIAIDSVDNLYVTDMFFGNFQIFNPQGKLLLPIGKLNEIDQSGHYRLISGISVDETNRVYVVDQFFKKIDIYRFLSDAEGNDLALKWVKSQNNN